ncbi:MAG: bifunctional 5-dehydro-2-deoxygluconokinase/5-dehydro-2-deoxyphosphogluconate aldolase [Alphaproteobacteria bacterium]
MPNRPLDVIGLGRSSVDLYGEQVGGRLEDMSSFAKYIGGSPTNTAIGASRLGLKSAIITRVGDEHMGRFIRETLVREGVDTSHVATDPDRLSALVILGIRDREIFPLIFYRTDCADMAIDAADIDPEFIASSKALLVSGTHFSTAKVDEASRTAMRHARAAGTKIVLDIDYRPVLWGLTGLGEGEDRFVADNRVTEHLQSIVAECDLVVGTEEELHIAGGSTDTITAMRNIRALSNAVIVAKLGPMGCSVFPGAIPDSLDGGIVGRGFPIEVFNILGAGDAFMSGFLRGWLRDESLETCCTYANACGAFAVSRHGCAPAIPSWDELIDFCERGSPHHRLREDPRINHIHWATTRRPGPSNIKALAFDHRSQLEDLVAEVNVSVEKISEYKDLIWTAASQVAGGRADAGIIVDDRYGQDVLFAASGGDTWIARPVELPGSIPLQFDAGPDISLTLRQWPVEHVVKCLVFFHPQDEAGLRRKQIAKLVMLQAACVASNREFLLEVIVPNGRPIEADTVPVILQTFYEAGVYPDWWKLQPPADETAWQNIADTIAHHDKYCRGVLLLGLEASEEELGRSFALARRQPICRGFAIGRSIFAGPARDWFAGEIDDAEAVSRIAASYRRVIALWGD